MGRNLDGKHVFATIMKMGGVARPGGGIPLQQTRSWSLRWWVHHSRPRARGHYWPRGEKTEARGRNWSRPVSAGAGGVFHTPGGPPAPLGPTCAAAAPLGTLPLPHVLGPQQVAPTFGVVDLTSSPPPLMSPALAAVGRLNRGRRMGGAVPPITAEASDSGDFIPVGRRSRSAPGRRMRTKTPDYGFSQVQEVEEGSRYFSQQAERAGLDG
jgi:hypothetical protein